jgi:tetratricopeptide (TPR) repeat protein
MARRLPTPPSAAAAAVGLAALVVAVYGRVRGHAYVNLDDPEYVVRNAQVLRGLTWDGVAWAFGGFRVANWHPLTWLSHMLDVELFGPGPAAPHLVNVALHAANTVLLFALLREATGATWRSAFAAALFGVHPLHAESVAWVSERKDVLSTLFLILALRAWTRFARSGRRGAYLAALGHFSLGLLAKPMVVTAPFLLLLLDAWPLGRLPLAPPRVLAAGLGRRAVEKWPFFALAAAASAVTWLAQSAGGGASAFSPIAAWPRVANAIVSYVRYPLAAVWPTSLAAFYPHPATLRADVDPLPVALSAALLVAVTAAAFRERVRRPWLAFGWAWYVGTLVPVIGLVQVGGQARADRYTYVPLVGLFVALAWGLGEIAERGRARRAAAVAAAGAAVVACAVLAWRQAGTWRDGETLHRHALAVTEGNWKAWHGLCDVLLEQGRLGEAAAACEAAIRVLPTFPEGWQTLGVVRARAGDPAAAIPLFRRALELRPDYFQALHNLGSALGNQGDYAQAVAHFEAALRLRPGDAETWASLGLARLRGGDREGALQAADRLRALDPARGEALRRRIDP